MEKRSSECHQEANPKSYRLDQRKLEEPLLVSRYRYLGEEGLEHPGANPVMTC